MELIQLFIFIGGIFLCSCNNTTIDGDDTKMKIAQGEKKLGDQIRLILKHYQQPDPIGLPGAPISDPMDIPEMKYSFSMYTIVLKSSKMYGLSKFRIEHVHSELAMMQISASLSIETVDVRGVYTLSTFSSWLPGSSGNYTVKLTGVNVQALAKLQVGPDGKLNAQDIAMDLTFSNIDLDFQNLGFLGSMFQSVVNSLGVFIFDSVKPFILKEVNTNIRGELNKQISQLPQYFPNSISPFDMAVAEARKQVSDMGYDPYRIKDYSQSVGIFTVMSSHTWLTGLASFYRMGNITLTMENGTVYAMMDVGTQEIEGKSHWEMGLIGGYLSRAGTVSFTVQYLRVQIKLSQPVDTRKRASLEELNFELGNIQTRVHGAGTLDYIIEAGVNILPNLLRYQIMDAIEGPVKRRLQDELDKVDVEKLINDKIPELEEKIGFLREMTPSEDIVLEKSAPPSPVDQESFNGSEEESDFELKSLFS